jgi:formylglycine-generating enzyme required for sulfatase activity
LSIEIEVIPWGVILRASPSGLRVLGTALTAAFLVVACSSDPSPGDATPDQDPEKAVTDGVKNGDETDVDCGGSSAPKCGLGKGCNTHSDCESDACKDGVCVTPSADDGKKNNGETDVDCGGPDPGTPRCEAGKGCNDGTDCASLVCGTTKKCAAPTFDDGVKNGGETDVDCGGPDPGPRCAAGLACEAHGDCASDGCAYDKKCATRPSCTKLEGGYTCGPTETAGRQEDCCQSAPVGAFVVDKYLITAGRMRTFIERLNGNVRGWAQGLPAGQWNQTYTNELPQNIAEADYQLGPYNDKRACQAGDYTGHTYWTTPTAQDRVDFPKEVLDTKALNCVPWWLMSAFCVWDGGHLATEAEIEAAYTNAGTTPYPWGARGTYVTNAQVPHAIQYYDYATPNPPATARRAANGAYLDITYHIAPPGRRAQGNNASGHADMVGNMLEWVSDRDRQFLWKGSFERHSSEASNISGRPNDPYLARTNGGLPWQWGYNIGTGRPGDGRGVGYYGIGGRCARTP